MRVSDDRYDRDRLRFDLAVRMIRHEARTCTIRAWTGLSDDRIRKLYRAYILGQHVEPVRRHRGKSPQQVDYFLRSPAILFEATTLASLYCLLGLLSTSGQGVHAPGVERGAQCCEACGRLYLRDVLGGERSTCNLCRGSQALARRSRLPSGRPNAG